MTVTAATAAAVVVQANAPITAEAQIVIPGARIGVVSGVPVLDADAMEEATRPDASIAEPELPVTTTTTAPPATDEEESG